MSEVIPAANAIPVNMPSSFAQLTRPVTLPDGRTAVIRKLNWTQLKAAAKAQTSASLQVMREMGAELVRAFREDRTKETIDKIEEAQKLQARKPSQYEDATVLLDGIKSFEGVEFKANEAHQLDPAAAEFLHEAIVNYAWEVPEKNG